MSRRPRRNHSPAFKAKVAIAAIKGERTISQIAEQFDVHPNQVTTWKAQLEGGAVETRSTRQRFVLACSPRRRREGSARKIGELTLENDFLEGALTKAGLLSAKR